MTTPPKLKKAGVVPNSTIDDAYAFIAFTEEQLEQALAALELPEKLSSYDNLDMVQIQQLAVMHAKYAARAADLETVVVKAKALEEATERALKGLKAQISLQLIESGIPKSEIPTRLETHSECIALGNEHFNREMHYRVLKAALDSMSTQAAAVSRIITARQTELETTQRNNGVPNRGRFPTGKDFRK